MNKNFSKQKLQFILTVAGILILVGGSYFAGYERGVNNPKTILVEGIKNIEDEDVTADFAIFWEAWKKLRQNHIDGEKIEDNEFVLGAISGIAGAFKDPNTIFLRADTGDAQKFEEDIQGSFGGIGAEIGLRDNQLTVISPLKKSPAERAGIKGGDKILEIDGFSTVDITLDEAVKRIRGLIDTSVVLNIFREQWTSSRDIAIKRDTIVVPTLDWEILEDGLAHISLHSFNDNVSLAFYDAVIDVMLKQSKGLILDLRNNPGGFLEVAINLAGWFVEKGTVVVKERFREPSSDRIFRANGNGALKDFPVVVLVNQGSASASEILAGALRDLNGVKLVGQKTFGKGTVQELHALRDNSKLKITVAKWVLPNGDIIEKEGLKPDVEVELTEEDVEKDRDPQLEKAIEVLKNEIQESIK